MNLLKFIIPIFISISIEAAESTLNWGTALGLNTDKKSSVARYQARVLEVAKPFTLLSFKAEKEIISEGKLPTDPGVADSKKVVVEISEIYVLAICSRIAQDSNLKESCQKAAIQGLLTWAKTYVPTGNPINENNLIPLIKAWDLVKPFLSIDDQKSLNNFGRLLVNTSDKYYENLKPTSGKIKNNWGTWRLEIRTITSQVLNESDLVKSSKLLLVEHINQNIKSDGASIDFELRDALHYHVYDLEAYMELLSILPSDFLSKNEMAKIKSAIFFLKPFYLGEKTHIEFVKSNVPFDIQRKNAKLEDYQNAPWKPAGARKLLRLARIVFPEIKPWTESLVDEHYDPTLKLFTAGRGD